MMLSDANVLPVRLQESSHESIETESYIADLMSSFHAVDTLVAVRATGTPDDVFDILSSRQFSYLGRSKSAIYRQRIVETVGKQMQQWKPIQFYYDIGGGYHAAPQRGGTLSFDVGLAELFILRQIVLFSNAIRSIYAPGVRFSLVIDNLCAFMCNDISLDNTTAYCRRLRRLIKHLQLSSFVDVLVESEHTSVTDVSRSLAAHTSAFPSPELTIQLHNNVERFLGRHCDEDEAMARAMRYKQIIELLEYFLAPLITGTRMTQRATPNTICFRPFPGGDSRTQCGEVVLTQNSNGKLVPFLMTNIKAYACRHVHFPHILPSIIPHITLAEPISS